MRVQVNFGDKVTLPMVRRYPLKKVRIGKKPLHKVTRYPQNIELCFKVRPVFVFFNANTIRMKIKCNDKNTRS